MGGGIVPAPVPAALPPPLYFRRGEAYSRRICRQKPNVTAHIAAKNSVMIVIANNQFLGAACNGISFV